MNDLGSRIASAQTAMSNPWNAERSNRVFGAALKTRATRARRHRVSMVLGAVASAALFVFVLRAGHHVHFSAAPSDFDRSSEPSSAGPDDLGAPQGPLTMNTDFGDGGSEAD
ncbi:MAG TPA: hypothetical protein VF407_12725 [Polyangiaceae bacterium]